MICYHGRGRTRRYFEGWYLKHQNENETVAFIPGVSFDGRGNKSAFIQMITDTGSRCFTYPFSDFCASAEKFAVEIGGSMFSEKGMRADIKDGDFTVEGTIMYGDLTRIKSDIMGPFSKMPFMECNHGIISLHHRLWGELEVNGRLISMNNGVGYIEKDWGRSFPKKYLWTQCNSFGGEDLSVSASVAHIPFLGQRFEGCIAVVCYRGREYRLATYNGAKIVRWDETGLEICRKGCRLKADFLKGAGRPLLAPEKGNMKRIISEDASCAARFVFYADNALLFDLKSDRASFEFAG